MRWPAQLYSYVECPFSFWVYDLPEIMHAFKSYTDMSVALLLLTGEPLAGFIRFVFLCSLFAMPSLSLEN